MTSTVGSGINYTVGTTIEFSQLVCGGCGIPYYVPSEWMKVKVNEKASFNCPNGCDRVFTGKSEAEKVKDKYEQLLREKNQLQKVLENKIMDTIVEKRKVEDQLKRVHKGVCPCCNRTFSDLQKHMKTKHPELIEKPKRGRPRKY